MVSFCSRTARRLHHPIGLFTAWCPRGRAVRALLQHHTPAGIDLYAHNMLSSVLSPSGELCSSELGTTAPTNGGDRPHILPKFNQFPLPTDTAEHTEFFTYIAPSVSGLRSTFLATQCPVRCSRFVPGLGLGKTRYAQVCTGKHAYTVLFQPIDNFVMPANGIK